MKVSFTYQQEEAPAVARLIARIRAEYPDSKLHKSEQHPPFIHAYVTVGNVKKSSNHAGFR